eukprot:TRINITY_DN14488_c0_g1_i1.p1 TRINITY_DN14488_c0_g1~~TRINITY_DN14488_c0_g1_i1.p1  ORF type:complete len:173 (-),score=33.72 TRINITY_DN14488_c0_g1_i1:211-729(-)
MAFASSIDFLSMFDPWSLFGPRERDAASVAVFDHVPLCDDDGSITFEQPQTACDSGHRARAGDDDAGTIEVEMLGDMFGAHYRVKVNRCDASAACSSDHGPCVQQLDATATETLSQRQPPILLQDDLSIVQQKDLLDLKLDIGPKHAVFVSRRISSKETEYASEQSSFEDIK